MRRFSPDEVLFAPTAACNLRCAHCVTKKSPRVLRAGDAIKVLRQCRDAGIGRVSFTGGEPFLAPEFLCAVSAGAVKSGLLFGRITTNGVWHKNEKHLLSVLRDLRSAGYDGSFCVSVDSFHRQDPRKVALFIETVADIWLRQDAVSIVYVRLARKNETAEKLRKLACIMKARFSGLGVKVPYIKNTRLLIKIFSIDLSPIGKAFGIKDAWGGKWFKEDYCRGPGNILLVMPDGSVKPCCGYASDLDSLTIGNIHRDSIVRISKNAKDNRYVRAVFGSGLSSIQKTLERKGVKFPGKTSNHCFFCHYILTRVPKPVLASCL